jgi:GT2 family glycosyltransferase
MYWKNEGDVPRASASSRSEGSLVSVTSGEQPSVSVIIPSLNSTLIDKTLESLFAQTAFDRIREVLVVGLDQPGLVSERGPVRFISTQEPVTAPVARNIGIQVAKGSCFAFIDADCMAQPTWLAELSSSYAKGHPVVGGSVSLDVGGYWQLCYNLSMFHEFLPTAPEGERRNFGTLNLYVDRPVVDAVGLFDERLARGQDTEWTLRMRRHGYRLHFNPAAVVEHLPQVKGLSGIVKLWLRSGFFNAQIRENYRDIILSRHYRGRPLLRPPAASRLGRPCHWRRCHGSHICS